MAVAEGRAGRRRGGGEEGGAQELDGAEGGAAGDEVDLVFIGTREKWEAF